MTDAQSPTDYADGTLSTTRGRAEGAFLGAAIGDALGWPHEMRATRASRSQRVAALGFESWTKRSGGRFQPHEETIAAGHYSDDTQLILAGARALLRAPANWWEILAMEELPLWTAYQRGGGGATKRAAASWLTGKAPWKAKPADVERYFSAGGNGVAMRVLPHCLRHAASANYAGLATDIMTDGVTTHGHPRALVGALAYGYGLWQAFRHRGTLNYGQLFAVVLAGAADWGSMPPLRGRWEGWRDAAFRQQSYEALWAQTVREQADLLDLCGKALAGGAAVIDEDALKTFGCFDRRVNGSGTVNAAAAIYLASRHAVEPVRGVTQAALSEGADTDTLASMVGALLGAAVGLEWTRQFAQELQDERVIRQVADELRELGTHNDRLGSPHAVTKVSLSTFLSELSEMHEASSVTLPNGLQAHAQPWNGVVSKSKSLLASAWKLTLEDGQTLFFKKLSKTLTDMPQETQEVPGPPSDAVGAVSPPIHLGFRLVVSNLSRSTAFYQEVLGLPVSKRTAKSVNLGGVLSIGEADKMPDAAGAITVFVEVRDLALSRSCYIKHLPEEHLRIDEWEDRTRLLCRDPDGYKLELYQLKRQLKPS